MNKPMESTLVEDSVGNKLFFFFRENTIYYKEVLKGESEETASKEILLINQVSEKYLVNISLDDTVYIVCHSKRKGVLLFIYSQRSWKTFEILKINQAASIHLLDLFIIGDGIHIMYASELSLAHFYNVYHLYNYEGSWKNAAVSEVFALNLEESISGALANDNLYGFVSIGYEGKKYSLNYNQYQININQWESKYITTLLKNDIQIKLLASNEKLHLICNTPEDNQSIMFYFSMENTISQDKNEILELDFVSLKKIDLNMSESKPAYSIQDNQMRLEWILGNAFYEQHMDLNYQEWDLPIEYPIGHSDEIYLVNSFKNRVSEVEQMTKYFFINKNLDYILPYQKTFIDIPDEVELNSNADETSNSNDLIEDDAKKPIANVDEFIPYLVEQIKTLSNDIKTIHTRLNQSELKNAATLVLENVSPKSENKVKSPAYHANSKFKENFMNKANTSESNMTQQPIIQLQGKMSVKSSQFKTNFENNQLNPLSYNNIAIFQGEKNNDPNPPSKEQKVTMPITITPPVKTQLDNSSSVNCNIVKEKVTAMNEEDNVLAQTADNQNAEPNVPNDERDRPSSFIKILSNFLNNVVKDH